MARVLEHRGPSSAHSRGRHGGMGQLWNADRPHAKGVGVSQDGSVRCVLGGSLFNRLELAVALALPDAANVDDADVVAELLAREGTAAITKLDGAFGLAAEDGEGCILVRDALGERPLYYSDLGDGTTLFATEVKAMLPHRRAGSTVRPNLASLSAVLVFSFIPGPDTMFEGVRELEPGSYVRLRPGQAPDAPVSYWSPREDIDPEWTDEAGAAHIAQLCRDAITRRMPTDGRRVAAFLSGGVDSSAVVALMAEAGISPVCLSVGFGYGQPNELAHARHVAEHCGVEHRIIDVEPDDFIDLLPEIIWRLDDPLCDCITVPNFILAKQTAAEASVVFNGEGGDPLFGGPKNKFMILGEWYKPYGGYDRHRAYLASYHKFYAHYDALCTPELRESSGGTDALCEQVAPYLDDPSTASFLNRLMKLNIRLKGGQNILVKVDKMLSCNAVRSASPLFDRRLTEYSMRIPPGAKRRGDVEKYAFKQAIDSLLPYAVVYRKKAGMGVPLNHWFRKTRLREYTRDILTSQRARDRGYFQPTFVESLLHEEGPPQQFSRDRSGEMLWMLLAIELWHRVFVDGVDMPGAAASSGLGATP
ncbi:asparagine synthetase B family protein [Enhygromyxa salina]|uniref:asparagine synthase (glutamine-hydrolyzing) n=1 Tax=Enhygromyxa salina TaxID=215803 RepID=A0A2S9YDD4_9BACT|nr:asparagine synthase-related protein [Enhygromyxa salina]PRQ03119.1 Asparagine synthetase 1 [Enhygromyxa salina]